MLKQQFRQNLQGCEVFIPKWTFPWRCFNVNDLSHCIQLFSYQKNQNANDVHCILLLKRSRMAVPLHLLQFFIFFFLIMALILIVSCCTLLFNVISSKNNIHPSAQLSKAICVCVFPQAVFYTSIYILVSFILICFSGIHKSLILFHKNHIMNVINTLKKRTSNGLVMVDFYIRKD